MACGQVPREVGKLTLTAWHSLAYLYPGLHPDGYDEPDSGWPRRLKPFAAEAWTRAEAGELADEELYPCESPMVRNLRPDGPRPDRRGNRTPGVRSLPPRVSGGGSIMS